MTLRRIGTAQLVEAPYHWSRRWSMLVRVRYGDGPERWHAFREVPGGPRFQHAPIRWWSPRDLIRFPLHWLWVRRYW